MISVIFQTYKPDRFLPDNMKKMDNFAFLPFSAGPRYDNKLKMTPYTFTYLIEQALASSKPTVATCQLWSVSKDSLHIYIYFII